VKKKNNNVSSLDLSYAHGTGIFKRLSPQDIDQYDSDEVSSGDTTIRAITSLFAGTRRIEGLDELYVLTEADGEGEDRRGPAGGGAWAPPPRDDDEPCGD
jgi:hypothetical protein